MELSELLERRRSVRAFKAGESVKKDDLKEMVLTALQAPTWKNSQTGRYYILHTPQAVAQIKENALPAFNQKSCENAPALIVTAFEKNRSGFDREGNAENELGNEWGAYDLGLQNQLLVLRASELGYDTLIMGIRDAAVIRDILNIPESQEIVSVIAVGKRETDPDKPVRKEFGKVATEI